ncbi:MAG TPA: alpha-N-acetylglucosaminidase TIM-barrel domain-containing protein, partial [Novosphingobium sp.]
HQLQRRILGRMRELGMKPILPAFSGYVPEAWVKRHPGAKVYRMREWEGFPGTYWIDPSDPAFARLAQRFIALYTATYGPGDYYLADAFNEMVPPIAEDGADLRGAAYGDATANSAATRAAALPPDVRDARLAAYGERLYRSIAAAAPGATWVMQGWLFGADKAFWTPSAIAAFLSRVPDERMLILDIGNDRYPGIWQQTQGFAGKRWVYGYVHNYGGSNPVYGDLGLYRSDLGAALQHPARGRLAGFGLFPEGLHSNSIVYAYAYDLAWGQLDQHGQAPALHDWLKTYTTGRYGHTSPALVAAWEKVIAGAYATRYWTPRWWQDRAGAYLFFKSPTLAGASYPPAPGDAVALREGIDALLRLAPRYAGEPLYRHDLVDLVRHYASLQLDQRLSAAIAAYQAGDLAAGDRAAADVAAIAARIDGLIGGQQETLGSWIADARAYGDTSTDRAAFVEQAKAIVTGWGGEGHLSDYASRAWQGLYAGYYLPRWRLFLTAQREAAVRHQPLDEGAVHQQIRRWEAAWLTDGRLWPRRVPKAPITGLRALLARVDRR